MNTENKLSVMIIEDSAIVSNRLVALISGVDGIEVVALADDGLQALSLFSKHEPDTVMLDIELPGMNGLKLLEYIKKERPSCQVIILTTYAFAEFRQRCLELGADYFLDKSMDFERVPEILRQMVMAR